MYHYFAITLSTLESNLTSYVSLSLFTAVSQKHDSFISSENNKHLIKGMNTTLAMKLHIFNPSTFVTKTGLLFIALRSRDFFIDPAEMRQTKSLFQALLRFFFFCFQILSLSFFALFASSKKGDWRRIFFLPGKVSTIGVVVPLFRLPGKIKTLPFSCFAVYIFPGDFEPAFHHNCTMRTRLTGVRSEC